MVRADECPWIPTNLDLNKKEGKGNNAIRHVTTAIDTHLVVVVARYLLKCLHRCFFLMMMAVLHCNQALAAAAVAIHPFHSHQLMVPEFLVDPGVPGRLTPLAAQSGFPIMAADLTGPAEQHRRQISGIQRHSLTLL